MTPIYLAPLPNWQRTRLRFLVESVQNGAWGSEEGEDEIDANCVRVADFDWDHLTTKSADPTIRSYSRAQLRKLALKLGDLLIEKSGGGEKTPVGRIVSYSGTDLAVCSNFVGRIRPIESVVSSFLCYLLVSLYYAKFSHQFIKQNTGIQNLDTSALFSQEVLIPNLATQKAIAAFLDRETARIDQLVEKKGRLVELLDEKLSSEITNIVEGMDWESMKLSRLVRFVDGDRSSEYPSGDDLLEEGIPFFSSKQISRRNLTLEDLRFISEEKFQRLGRGKLQNGDIIITVRGTLGNSAIFRSELAKTGFINAQLMIMRPLVGFDPDLIHFFTRSQAWDRQISIEGYGSAQKQLNQDILRRFKAHYPANRDVTQWTARTSLLIHKYDETVSAVEKSIDRLHELRSALITAAVTGQIDVESWGKDGRANRHLDQIQEEMHT